jgi:hypothetical protein
MRDEELNSYNLISTYVGSKIFERLDDSWTKIIVFRDPIARLRSSYLNLRNSPKNKSLAYCIAKSCTFSEYLACREASVIVQATNVQTWSVLGDKSIYFRCRNAELGNEQILETALQRLPLYGFVGFTEQLDRLWSRLCSHFGWPVTPLPRLRVNPASPEPGEVSAEDLAFHTTLDCEFVRRAQAMVSSNA